MVLGGREFSDGDGLDWIESHVLPDRRCRPTRWTISMHPQMLNELVVLHELAHCLAPRHAQLRAKWRLPYAHVAQLPAHGPGFAAAMSELVDEFASGADRDELRSAYRHYEVGVLDPASYRQAISESLRSEDAVMRSTL